MTSQVEICNIALSNIRAGSINSLNEASLEAQQCRLKYDILLRQILRDAPWQFARRVRSLALLDNVEVFNYAYAYQYPTDCLKINRLILNFQRISGDAPNEIPRALIDSSIAGFQGFYPYGDQHRVNFKHQVDYEIHVSGFNKVIAANQRELRADYVSYVDNPNQYDDQFIMALSHLISAELAIPVVGFDKGRQLRIDSLQLYSDYIDAAIAANGDEQFTTVPDSELVLIRN